MCPGSPFGKRSALRSANLAARAGLNPGSLSLGHLVPIILHAGQVSLLEVSVEFVPGEVRCFGAVVLDVAAIRVLPLLNIVVDVLLGDLPLFVVAAPGILPIVPDAMVCKGFGSGDSSRSSGWHPNAGAKAANNTIGFLIARCGPCSGRLVRVGSLSRTDMAGIGLLALQNGQACRAASSGGAANPRWTGAEPPSTPPLKTPKSR